MIENERHGRDTAIQAVDADATATGAETVASDTAATTPRKRGFRTWPAWQRIVSIVGAGIVVVAIMATLGVVAYQNVIEPPIARATAEQCHKAFTSNTAREDCRAGDIRKARSDEKTYKATQQQQAIADKCEGLYTSRIAVTQCESGDTDSADATQKAADDAAAAAQKKATEGQSFSNPYPVGTQASMQSTNRLDGTTSTYAEWITDFNPNWTGYDSFEAPDTGMKYVSFVVHVQATTAGVDAGTVAFDASFTDSNGSVYSHSTAQYGAGGEMPQVTLGAGQQASGIVVFEVPTSVAGGVATFGDGTVFEALQ
ncbi:hypothetical protein GCM10028798_05700 [Humibacter antri]